MIKAEAAQVDNTPNSEDRRQQLIYDPAVGVTLAWTPDPASNTPTQEASAERARNLALLASSGAWVFLGDTPE